MNGEDRTAPPGPEQPEAQAEVPPWRLVATLGSAGVLAGLLIVFVFAGTQPTIKAHKAEELRLAVVEVLKNPASFDTLFVHENALDTLPPAGVNPADAEQIYVGRDGNGSQVGFAIVAAEPGFQDVIRLIFGYDAATARLLGMKVLENKETPGLGDKIVKDQAFIGQFDGALTPLVGVKSDRATGADQEIDMITGATISSRSVIRIINNALERLGPMIEAYNNGGGSR